MAKVDSKGRIVLPQDVRDRLGIVPGSEVEVREEDGKAIVDPEDDPERILERMEHLVEDAASRRGETTPPAQDADPIARRHGDIVRRAVEDRDE